MGGLILLAGWVRFTHQATGVWIGPPTFYELAPHALSPQRSRPRPEAKDRSRGRSALSPAAALSWHVTSTPPSHPRDVDTVRRWTR
jgi:hypothetical protein